MAIGSTMRLFIKNTPPKSFAIDSVDYHRAGRDNNLQVTPYWMCHLKGTNQWIRVTENKEVGDSLQVIIKY
jgi:hypothetical protein